MYVALAHWTFVGYQAYPFHSFDQFLQCLAHIPSEYLSGYSAVDYEISDIDMGAY